MRVSLGTNFTDNGVYTGWCPQPTKTMGFINPTGLGRLSATSGSSSKLNFKQGIGIGISIGIDLLFITLGILWFCRPRRSRWMGSETPTEEPATIRYEMVDGVAVLQDGRR